MPRKDLALLTFSWAGVCDIIRWHLRRVCFEGEPLVGTKGKEYGRAQKTVSKY